MHLNAHSFSSDAGTSATISHVGDGNESNSSSGPVTYSVRKPKGHERIDVVFSRRSVMSIVFLLLLFFIIVFLSVLAL